MKGIEISYTNAWERLEKHLNEYLWKKPVCNDCHRPLRLVAVLDGERHFKCNYCDGKKPK